MAPFAFFGQRSADIEQMIAALASGDRDCAAEPPAPVARALGPVADDTENLNPQDGVKGADAERFNLDVMEHERQNRLRRWQTPPLTTRSEV